MLDRKDYYEILGVDQGASRAEVRSARNRKALELHPDRLSRASEAVRRAALEKMKQVNEAYAVLGDDQRRRRYDAERRLRDLPPKPVIAPTHLVFEDADPGEMRTASFVIRNEGGPCESIWVSDPDSWVQISGYASLEDDDELPLRVDVRARGRDWGRNYKEAITVTLDGASTVLTLRLRTRTVPQQRRAAPAPVATSSTPSWVGALGVMAGIAIVIGIIGATVSGSSGTSQRTYNPAVYQQSSYGPPAYQQGTYNPAAYQLGTGLDQPARSQPGIPGFPDISPYGAGVPSPGRSPGFSIAPQPSRGFGITSPSTSFGRSSGGFGSTRSTGSFQPSFPSMPTWP